MSAAGAVAAVAAQAVVEFVDLDEFWQFHALNEQLGDPVAAADGDGGVQIVVDQTHLDLTAIAGVDGARSVDDRQTRPSSQTRPRVDQSDGADRECDGYPGPDQGSASRFELEIRRGEEVDARVVGMGSHRQWESTVQAADAQRRTRLRSALRGSALRGHPRRVLADSPTNLGGVTESSKTAPSRADRYSERLTAPWWWWLAGAALTLVLGYEIQLAAYRQSWSVVAYPLLGALIAWGIWSMGRTHIRIDADGAVHAHKAVLPAEVISRGAAIGPSQRSAAMGRQLDPAAFLIHRSWIKSMVLLVLDDPDDPTPYWLVSTRHPEKILEALEMTDAARD